MERACFNCGIKTYIAMKINCGRALPCHEKRQPKWSLGEVGGSNADWRERAMERGNMSFGIFTEGNMHDDQDALTTMPNNVRA